MSPDSYQNQFYAKKEQTESVSSFHGRRVRIVYPQGGLSLHLFFLVRNRVNFYPLRTRTYAEISILRLLACIHTCTDTCT